MNQQATIMHAALLCLCSLLLTGSASAQQKAPAGFGYVASELVPLPQLDAALPLLASYKVALVLDWPASELASPARYAFVKKAAQSGVEVRPWLLLSEEQGLWANAVNATQYDLQARRLVEAWLQAGLRPTTFVVDMEMPIDRVRRFAEFVTKGDTDGAIAFLRSNIDRAQYARATAVYRGLVDYLHAKGFKVELSVWSQVLDDYADGDDSLRQAFSVPVDTIAWDTVTIQAYRTLNDTVLNNAYPKTGPAYVFDYARRARAQFGTRGSVIVGMTDAGDLAPDAGIYASSGQVREDVDAATWAGIPRANLGLYNLRGILRRTPSSQWFPAASLIPLPPFPFDLATIAVKLNTANLDLNL